jgi:tetratricopeptide (TPR) repeat protein
MMNEPLILAVGAVVLLGFAAGVGLMTARQMRSREKQPVERKIELQIKPASVLSGLDSGDMSDPAAMEARERERLVNALQVGDTGDASRAYANLAGLAFARGDTRGAERLFRKAVELDHAIGDLARTAGNACNLGLVHLAQGDLEAAEARLQQGRELFTRLGDTTRVGYIDRLLGMFAARKGMVA